MIPYFQSIHYPRRTGLWAWISGDRNPHQHEEQNIRAVGSDFQPTPKSVSCSGRGSEAHERWISYAWPKAARNAAAENTGPGQLAQPGSREIPTLQGRDKPRTIWEKVRPGIQPVSGALEDESKVVQKDTRVQSRKECHLWVLPQPLFCMCVGVGGSHAHIVLCMCACAGRYVRT